MQVLAALSTTPSQLLWFLFSLFFTTVLNAQLLLLKTLYSCHLILP
jgi:hypothetical protein